VPKMRTGTATCLRSWQRLPI